MRSVQTRATGLDHLTLAGRMVELRIVPSKIAKKLRIRVGITGVEVVQPRDRSQEDVAAFLQSNADWVIKQLERVERFRCIRKSQERLAKQILFRGQLVFVRVEEQLRNAGANRVSYELDRLIVLRSSVSETAPARSLENWLRKQARVEILSQLKAVTAKLRRGHGKILIMEQRTKWGNCSASGNLSFNWRLILAPEFVLRYLVTHEAVHLAVPNHSHQFWLTVRSICPESERARQWLCTNGHLLQVDLNEVCR